MNGKTLVISGGTRGIGRAIVERFADKGANIAFTYNSNEEEAAKIVAEIEAKYSIKARAYKLDILEPEEYKGLFELIDADFDRVDYFL
jgi:7-alpha-hydroxysteroid dehydrogenase